MKNLAIVWTPHFNTNCFRADKRKQKGEDVNYIICTCSLEYNGIYKWDSKIAKDLTTWTNNGLPCYEVPLSVCEKVQTLDTVKNKVIQEAIVKSQKEFCKKYRKKQADWVQKY